MQSVLDITRATWSNYENGVTEPSLNKLIDIAKFFRIRIDVLLLKDLQNEQQPYESELTIQSGSGPREYSNAASERLSFEENQETTLWYLLKEIKSIRKDLDQLMVDRG